MGKFAVTGMTVSVEVADINFGAGTKYFTNISAKVPDDAGLSLDSPEEILSSGLDLFETVYKSVTLARCASSNIDRKTMVDMLNTTHNRVAKLKTLLTAEKENSQQ